MSFFLATSRASKSIWHVRNVGTKASKVSQQVMALATKSGNRSSRLRAHIHSCRPSSDLHMCPWHTVIHAVYRCAYSYKVNRRKGFPQGWYFLLLFVVLGIEFQVSRYQAWALSPSFPSPEFCWQTACQKRKFLVFSPCSKGPCIWKAAHLCEISVEVG